MRRELGRLIDPALSAPGLDIQERRRPDRTSNQDTGDRT